MSPMFVMRHIGSLRDELAGDKYYLRCVAIAKAIGNLRSRYL